MTLAPCFTGRINEGITEFLCSLTAKFCVEFKGILLAFDNISTEEIGVISTESPFLHFYVTGDFTVFRPAVGQELVGVVNKVSKEHLGLICFGLFNVSLNHVPKSILFLTS